MKDFFVALIGFVGSVITIFVFVSGVPSLSELLGKADSHKEESRPSPPPSPKQEKGANQARYPEGGEARSPPKTPPEVALDPKKNGEAGQFPREPQIEAADRFSKTGPSVSWQRTFAQAVSDIEKRSQWRPDPALSSFLREGSVEVVFTEQRLQDAAQIVHRLRIAGAEVRFRIVSDEASAVKQTGLYYHWNRLQMAQAIYSIVQDVQVLELLRNDQSQLVAIWII